MIDFPDYEKATNAAYDVLKCYKGHYPQIDVLLILSEFENISIHTYSDTAQRMSMSFSQFVDCAPSEYGFTIYDKEHQKWIVFYNDQKDVCTIRFTLAHELGHIVLRHDDDNYTAKCEANCFARNLLCPVPLRDGFNLSTTQDYCDCFNISEPMAKATLGRNSSDVHYITKDSYQAINDNAYYDLAGYSPADLYGY